MKAALFALLAATILVTGVFLWLRGKPTNPPPPPPPTIPPIELPRQTDGPRAENGMHRITIATNHGDIVFKTYDADAPRTVENFVTLAEKGFYNGLTFHRIVRGFVIQGGDPNGDGTGGPGYTFPDELNPTTESYRTGYRKGVVAMANAGPNTNGSQFFIVLEDVALPHSYSIFGKVISGQEVVAAIGQVAASANDKPLEPVRMTAVRVEAVR